MSLYVHESRPFADVDPDLVVRRWRADVPIRGASFACSDGRLTAVLHGSTRTPGHWQVSYFDADGAVGDSQFSSVDEALREVGPGCWALTEVVS